jgi:SAM-dependent methyltransferase
VTNIDVNDRTAFYDDDGFNYQSYWSNRNYEHRAEVIAIRRLLNGRRFGHAADIGGGYGRLSVVLEEFAEKITLVDASSLDFPDASVDLVAMVRVLHHLPDPAAELAEVHRILRPGGAAVVEVANVAHALNRVRHMVRRERLPMTAVDIRSAAIREQGGIPFVNHHPATVAKQFRTAGLQIERVLSVSNLRHPLIKKALPGRAILAAERIAQARLAKIQFGPSLFFLLRK